MPQLHLAIVDCFLIPKLKTQMKGKRFTTIKEKSKQEPKKAFQKCFDGGHKCRDKIVIDKSILFEKIINYVYFLITPRINIKHK